MAKNDENVNTVTIESDASNIKNGQSSCYYQQLLFPIIALLALLIALLSGFQTWRLHIQQQLQEGNVTQRLNGLKQLQADLEKTTVNTQDKLTHKVQDLDKNLHTALKQRLYQKQDWLLLKARYYLELAQINAQWSTNQETSIALLQEGDNVLQSMSVQDLLPIRQAIAKEIADLKALPVVDAPGLLSELDALQSIVLELPIKKNLTNPPLNSSVNQGNQASSGWRASLQESLNLLKKLVIIRRHDADISPLLSPMHQALLRETVRMNLQEAQMAILKNNQALYQFALKNALAGILRIFDQDAKGTQSLIEQLHVLQQKNLSVPKPKINQSLTLLNGLIESNNEGDVAPSPLNKKEESL